MGRRPGYIHVSKKVREGLTIHALYKIDIERLKESYDGLGARQKAEYGNSLDSYLRLYKAQWEQLLEMIAMAQPFVEKNFGKYPYSQYSFIQGGDGGMEYSMATLVRGRRRRRSYMNGCIAGTRGGDRHQRIFISMDG
ncbi:MAG: hypothetical protein WDN26_00700 [Chitinophagaceae bacterium]